MNESTKQVADWGSPEHERQRMLDRIDAMEKALRKILFARPPGPIPKLINGSLIERIEVIARDAIQAKAEGRSS